MTRPLSRISSRTSYRVPERGVRLLGCCAMVIPVMYFLLVSGASNGYRQLGGGTCAEDLDELADPVVQGHQRLAQSFGLFAGQRAAFHPMDGLSFQQSVHDLDDRDQQATDAEVGPIRRDRQFDVGQRRDNTIGLTVPRNAV